jgi:hypothetical protein
MKGPGHNYKFIWNIILFDEAIKYGDSPKFWDFVRTKSLSLCGTV